MEPLKDAPEVVTAYANDVIRAIYTRRAVRKYKSWPVDRKIINDLLDAGRMAPSAVNSQPWKFYVITDPGKIQKFSDEIRTAAAKHFMASGPKKILKNAISLLHFPGGLKLMTEKDPVFHEAPVVIFITSPKDDEWADLDIGMCVQNIMLAAKSLGLDTCPIGFGKFVEKTKSFSQLGIPDKERVCFSLIVGYGNEIPETHRRIKKNVIFV